MCMQCRTKGINIIPTEIPSTLSAETGVNLLKGVPPKGVEFAQECDRFPALDFPRTERLRSPIPNNRIFGKKSGREIAFRK